MAKAKQVSNTSSAYAQRPHVSKPRPMFRTCVKLSFVMVVTINTSISVTILHGRILALIDCRMSIVPYLSIFTHSNADDALLKMERGRGTGHQSRGCEGVVVRFWECFVSRKGLYLSTSQSDMRLSS